MATDLENLETAKSRISEELAAGDIKPSYSIDGRSVSWGEYRRNLLDEYERLQKLISAQDPFEFRSVII